MRSPFFRILLTVCLLLVSSTYAIAQQPSEDDHPDSTTITYTHPGDTVWIDHVTGSRIHLQRLFGSDTLVMTKRSVILPVLEAVSINHAVWAFDHYATDREWARIDIHSIRRNLRHNFTLDLDSYSGNQFSHPYHGSMFYNAARYHGNSYYAASLYPLIGSMMWEYFCETNYPSYNDFISTGFGGTAIGEATFRMSDIAFDNSSTGVKRIFHELAGTVLNPSRGLHRLLSGEMWHVSPSRGKHIQPEPFSFDVGVGNRYMHETRNLHRNKRVGYIDFQINYGDRFADKEHAHPYDWFRMHTLINLSQSDPTFSDVDIRGRILSTQYESSRHWQFDIGLYQNYRYIDNYGDQDEQRPGDYALINEACSFGTGLYAQKLGTHVSFSNDLLFSAVPFGGTTADYYQARRYNFATGFSLRNDIRVTLNNYGAIGDDLYFARLYVPKGPRNPHEPGLYDWGDKGNNSILYNRAYLLINMRYNLKLNAEHIYYIRKSNYSYFPSRQARNYELKLGLIYSI